MVSLCHFKMSDFFFFNDTATTEIYTLSLHDALPISPCFVVPMNFIGCTQGTLLLCSFCLQKVVCLWVWTLKWCGVLSHTAIEWVADPIQCVCWQAWPRLCSFVHRLVDLPSLALFGGSRTCKCSMGEARVEVLAICTFWTAVQMWSIFTQLRSQRGGEIVHQL